MCTMPTLTKHSKVVQFHLIANVQFILMKAKQEQLRETLIIDFFVFHCYLASFQPWLEPEVTVEDHPQTYQQHLWNIPTEFC